MHDTRRSIGPTGGRSMATNPGWSSVIGDGNEVRACDPKLCEKTLGQRSAYGDVIHPAATATIAATEKREPSLRCTQSVTAGAIVIGKNRCELAVSALAMKSPSTLLHEPSPRAMRMNIAQMMGIVISRIDCGRSIATKNAVTMRLKPARISPRLGRHPEARARRNADDAPESTSNPWSALKP